MSELRENRWAVLSERGVEAAALDYDGAARLVAQLRAGRVYGLCIVTSEAAARLNHKPAPAKRRAPRRKASKS
ncbi:MAG TPA: hypothetical protein VF546_24695 [Pyrinomonadaceae bacterium]|jgi:hypothetical protein